MTQQTQTFQTLNAFAANIAPAKVQESFVPMQAFGAGLAADSARQKSLMSEVELKRQQAILEIEQKEAALNQREAALNQREQDLVQAAQDFEVKQTQLLLQIQSSQQVADTFEDMKKNNWAQNADEVVSFALSLVERLFHERLIEDPSVLVTQIRSTLEDMKVEGSVTVRLAPENFEALMASQKKEIQDFVAQPHIKIVSDSKLKSGDALIDTNQFRLDASLSAALANIKQDLTEVDQNKVLEQQAEIEKKDE